MMAEEFYKVRDAHRINPSEGPVIRVLATRDGQYKCLRPAYDALTGVRYPAFEIPVKLFSPTWMEPADEESRKAIEAWKIQKVKDQKVTLLAELAAKKEALAQEEAALKVILEEKKPEEPEEAAPVAADVQEAVKRGPGRPKKI